MKALACRDPGQQRGTYNPNVTEYDMGKVRAKFRCMEISHQFNGKGTNVRFLPVMPKTKTCDWGDSEENATFWDATPCGTAELWLKTLASNEIPYVLGHCYYIDMKLDENGGWFLDHINCTENQRDIELRSSATWNSRVQMGINNKDAWPAFENAGAGSKWNVVFSAEGDNDE